MLLKGPRGQILISSQCRYQRQLSLITTEIVVIFSDNCRYQRQHLVANSDILSLIATKKFAPWSLLTTSLP